MTARVLSHRLLSHFTVKSARGKISRGSLMFIVSSPSSIFAVHTSPSTVHANSAINAAKRGCLGIKAFRLMTAVIKLKATRTAPKLVPN